MYCPDQRVIKDLIELGGAKTNAENFFGTTPLHLASMHGNYKAIAALLLYGGTSLAAEISAPKRATCAMGHYINLVNEILYLLSVRSAAVDLFGIDAANTALHDAARYGHLTACRTLIAAGASTVATNRGGWTPADLAFMQGHHLVGKMIEGAGSTGVAKDRTYSSARWELVEARYIDNFNTDLSTDLQKKLLGDLTEAGFVSTGEGVGEEDLANRFFNLITMIRERANE